MIRMTLALAGLLSSAAAAQSVGGPEIAFVKATAKGDEIHFINPDATGLTKFYPVGRGASSGKIERIAVRPGGGEIAWVEDNLKVKIQAHDSMGRPVGTARQVTIANNCVQGDLDYHPDGRLLISDGCWGISVVQPGGNVAAQVAVAGQNVSAVRWANDGSILWQEGQLDGMRIVRRASDGTRSVIGPVEYFPPHWGMSQVAEETAISDSYTYRIFDLTDGSSEPGCMQAGWVKLSPNGTQMLYRSPGYVIGSNTLFVQKRDCSGAPFRLMAKGAYRHIVWRRN